MGLGARVHIVRILPIFALSPLPTSSKLGRPKESATVPSAKAKEFVLVVGQRVPSTGDNNFSLVAVYPLGKPNDFVDETVPPEIASDFREALRCQWIEAHKATVTMCRRALQASAIALGASGERLIYQIDYLATKGTITSPLKALAHEVRVTGNVGAHPDRDGLSDVKKEDAVDMVEFTREFFHHVYVMPAKLKARAPKAAEKTS